MRRGPGRTGTPGTKRKRKKERERERETKEKRLSGRETYPNNEH